MTVGFQSEVDCVVCNAATTLTTSPPPPELAGKVPMVKVATVVSDFVPTKRKAKRNQTTEDSSRLD